MSLHTWLIQDPEGDERPMLNPFEQLVAQRKQHAPPTRGRPKAAPAPKRHLIVVSSEEDDEEAIASRANRVAEEVQRQREEKQTKKAKVRTCCDLKLHSDLNHFLRRQRAPTTQRRTPSSTWNSNLLLLRSCSTFGSVATSRKRFLKLDGERL